MRITLLMNFDIASNFALNQLVKSLAEHELTVFVSEKLGKAGAPKPTELQQLNFIEQALFNDLLFPLLARTETRSTLLSFAALAQRIGRPTQPLNRINSEAGLARLQESRPELIISMRYGGFLREEAIAVPKFGVLNLHAGLLPQYRGLMATFRAMLDGNSDYGCTLHYIVDSSVDTGPVVSQTKLPIIAERSYLWHVLNMYPQACEMVSAAVDHIARTGSAPSSPQSTSGHYYSAPNDEEIQQFRAQGFKFFDGNELVEFAQGYIAP